MKRPEVAQREQKGEPLCALLPVCTAGSAGKVKANYFPCQIWLHAAAWWM